MWVLLSFLDAFNILYFPLCVKRIFLKIRLAKVPEGWYNMNGRDTDER